MEDRDFVKESVEKRRKAFTDLSDSIWDFAETSFKEYKSIEVLCDFLEKEGFKIERGLAGIPTAFSASYGTGEPVVAFLGEYDALSGMSQKCGASEPEALIVGGNGHGCGHNLLGVGSLAAAVAVKDYIEENKIEGTVKYFGCPAEESGGGKTFMARDGVFKDVDAALTWHPSTQNSVLSVNFLASLQYRFKFHGISSHAAGAPFLGRSALDAVELMNVGSNYLREHMIPEARIHYAVINTGGTSPNVVQSEAEVLYYVRSPKVSQAFELAERVCNIARGAALMTGTECEILQEDGISNLIPNRTLEGILYESFLKTDIEAHDESTVNFMKKIRSSLSQQNIMYDIARSKFLAGEGDEEIERYTAELSTKVIADTVSPYRPSNFVMPGSTDVGDVSWVVPTAQIVTACSVIGTQEHSWQLVSQGRTEVGHKGMLTAGKVLGLAGIKVLTNPEIAVKANEELKKKLAGEKYVSPLPEGMKPLIK